MKHNHPSPRLLRSILLGATLLLSLSNIAVGKSSAPAAQGYLPPPERLCEEDRMKYCSQIERGYGRVENCLRAQQDNLIPACKTFLDNKQAEKKALGTENVVDPMSQ